MPWNRPTLTTLVAQREADLKGRFPGAESGLRRSVLSVIARVYAAGLHGLYGFLEYLAEQILVDQAEGDWLVRHSSIYEVPPKPAVAAAGDVSLTGVNTTVILAGAELQRRDGVRYATTEDAVITGGVAVVAVEAIEPGSAGNASEGVAVTLVSPIAGVTSAGAVAAGGITGGEDAEREPRLRARTLQRIRFTPQGGAPADYERWALECAGVTRAWVRKGWMGPGTVGVLFTYDDRPDIIPTTPDIETVQAYLDLKAPVTATVYALAPQPVAWNPVITVTPDTPTIRAAVEAELKDLLVRSAAPGVDIPRTALDEAISIAPGEFDHELVDYDDTPRGPGQISVLGAVDWGD